MQTYIEKDNTTVQDLYDEIEHLIDVPFDKYSPTSTNSSSCHQPKDFHYKEYHDDEIQQEEEIVEPSDEEEDDEQTVPQSTTANINNHNDYSFDRPILIESDSDDIEEELLTPDQLQYDLPVCFKCDRPITFQNTLNVSQENSICAECSNKKRRTRSSSFTFTQLADKLKQSFGHSSSSGSSQLLSPAIKNVDRRKSMPSMNSLFDNQEQALAPPSPVPSRPSSRASSFIEDVKQFLAPLSRKSSRNSMHQEYQRSLSPAVPEGPKRKTSHSSLLDVINICKHSSSSKPKQAPSYERRLIYQPHDISNVQQNNTWEQEDEEVMGVHRQNSDGYFTQQQDDMMGFENNIHIPLRRKQIKSIESRQDRIDIYNNAFFDCMRVETNLVPWIIKQTQKGPPDAWFGYTPPERQPKKIMGIFKRKPKARDSNISLRTQQQQLGDELLNRSTPLLRHRYSNSNLSVSPGNNSFAYSPDHQQEEYVTSPGGYEDEQDVEEGEEAEYFDQRYMSPSSNEQRRFALSSSLSPSSHGTTNFSPNNTLHDPVITARPSSVAQPVSILKKTNSNVSMQRDYQQQQYADDDQVLNYDDNDDDEEDYYHFQAEYQSLPPPRQQQQQQQRRPSSNASADYDQQHHQGMMMPIERKQQQKRYSTSPGGHSPHSHMYMMDSRYPPHVSTRRRARSNSNADHSDYQSEEDEYYHRSSIPTTPTSSRPSRYHQQRHCDDDFSSGRNYYNNSIAMNKRNMTRRNSRQPSQYDDDVVDHSHRRSNSHYEEEDSEDIYYQPPPPTTKRRGSRLSSKPANNTYQQEYYGMSVKMTPYMMEEWEIALDDLCELYPRLDRHYINDFLRSAQGDFVTAKDMIMQMIMEIR